jgi:hypothetical protein
VLRFQEAKQERQGRRREHAAGAAAQVAAAAALPGWGRLRAVRAGQVYPVDPNGCLSRPGPRLVDGIERLAEIFHPIVKPHLDRPAGMLDSPGRA